MAEKLETAEEFTKTLAEVDLLLFAADEAAPGKPGANELTFAVMNKSALLLLTGKFEAFLEGAAEDFLFALNQVGAKGRDVPVRILAEHSVKAVREMENKLNSGDFEEIQRTFVSLARYWIDLDPCSNLSVSCKFNYGKHGEAEVSKLFKRLGIADVFESVTIVDETVEVYEGGSPPLLDVKGMINSLTGIRNNILHQDETPNLTTGNLRKQSASLQRFATALVSALQGVVDDLDLKHQADRIA